MFAPPPPTQLTSFVGRERELSAIRQLLDTTRLLTLTGAGGSGKTRLAAELAGAIQQETARPVAWVDLAVVSDPDLVAHHVASGLGVRAEGSRPAADALVEALRERQLVLMLDNCEHLVDAVAALVEALLQHCAGVRVLATSRETLAVAGETAWLVPGLSLPDPGHSPEVVGASEAARLFVDRAQAVLPAFRLDQHNAAAVAKICRRLDGIPLAIELAAARARMLAPLQIAERLDDVFRLLAGGGRTAVPRQRTLRATIDWSYTLLGEREQRLLERLSVFAESFSLEAAEAVGADEQSAAEEVLDLLSSLVEKSLVFVEEARIASRYRLLETVRQYAHERLRVRGVDAEALQAHARFYLELAEGYAAGIAQGRPETLELVAADRANFRAALEWSRAAGDPGHVGLRIAAALWWFWFQRVHWAEGRRCLEGLLERGGDDVPVAVRAEALHGLALLSWMLSDQEVARARARQAVALWSRTDDERGHGSALATLALTHYIDSDADPDQVLAWAQAGVSLARSCGDPLCLARVLQHGLGPAYLMRGDLAAAGAAFAESERIARQAGSDTYLVHALYCRWLVALRAGDASGQDALGRAALEPLRRLRDPWTTARGLYVLASAAAAAGQAERAMRLLGASEAVREAIGADLIHVERPRVESIVARARERLPESRVAALRAEGRAMSVDEALRYAESGEPVPVPSATTAEPGGALHVEVLPSAQLTVRALGPLEILKDGVPLPADAWSFSRPKELFLFLLAHPSGVARERIGLAFWPDASPAQVRNSFHVTLHHLRKALGRSEWVVLDGDRYRVNPELRREFDVEVFETEITAALRQHRAGSASVELLRRSLAHYRGDFAESEGCGDWHCEIRDRLLRLYVQGLSALGGLLVRDGRYAEAADVYRRLIVKEDLDEDAHRNLMVCYARSGERARALQQFELLTTLLREELDAVPEPETVELVERLRRADAV